MQETRDELELLIRSRYPILYVVSWEEARSERLLRDLGTTHVPCVIQKAATPSELTSVAAGGLRKRPDFYVKDPRPPVLKDYFEPRLRQVLRLRPINRHVKVRFTVETYDVYKK